MKFHYPGKPSDRSSFSVRLNAGPGCGVLTGAGNA